ncbi:proteasome activator complex subunit 4-like isoform X3 [Biomphalaria glabrata]|uniref:Proteasome activator complex subunit 4-like isoform X3 n=1 Tax=Biomphalaria glabrata TaxID=6526 RepID=A0A9W3A1D3_BIOGL|nr:proteasome activator complex subunit 4-like isoform X3 [Biomphalaria glabrata]
MDGDGDKSSKESKEKEDTATEDSERDAVFQIQKVYNSLLPYYKDAERKSIFAEIKSHLGRAVQLRDLKIGFIHWVQELERYIFHYGYHFSKADHILLVELAFQVLTMSSHEYALLDKMATLLTLLLSNKELLTRKDLMLPWRPLYTIYKTLSCNKKSFPKYPRTFLNNLNNTVLACKLFFHEDATREMLDEWRPLLYPLGSTQITYGLRCFDYFLPISVPPHLHHKGFKLWLDEFLQLWLSIQNMPSWEANLVYLFSDLAQNNIGYIDWLPYIPMIFNRLLRSFCLPIGEQYVVSVADNQTYNTTTASTWIVSMMGGSDHHVVQEHITKLFKSLHSFYHPSNGGQWTDKLCTFLMMLPEMVVKRLRRERYSNDKGWLTPVPDSHKLTESQVTVFVESLKSAVFLALFGKSGCGADFACKALNSLATLRPALVLPPLLEKMYQAMETLTEPHRVFTCIIAITWVVRPLVSSVEIYPEGQLHVLPLLKLSLPGIDPNDNRKTLATLQMITNVVVLIPIVDSSDAVHKCPNLTEHQREVCSLTAQFEDFVMTFLDRIFNLIKNSRQEVTCESVKNKTADQLTTDICLHSSVSAILQQCSSSIYTSALRRINHFITSNVFEVKVSGKLAAVLCRAAVRANPVLGLKTFVPHLCSSILRFIQEYPGVKDEDILDNTLLWNLLILSHVVSCEGSSLLPYQGELFDVMKHTLHFKSVQCYNIAGQMLNWTLKSLTQIYPLEFHSNHKGFERPVEEDLPIKDWGTVIEIDEMNVGWHQASDVELEFAQFLIDELLVPQLHFFQNISSDSQISKEEILCRLNIVLKVLIGADSHFPSFESETVKLTETQVPLRYLSCIPQHDKRVLTADGKNVRALVHDTMHDLLKYMNVAREDDTKCLFLIINIYQYVTQHYKDVLRFSRWQCFGFVKILFESQLLPDGKCMRALLIEEVHQFHELKMLNRSNFELTFRHLDILKDLLELSVSRYKTGSLYALERMGSKKDWSVMSMLLPALFQVDQSNKPSILKVIKNILNAYKNMETFAITFKTSDEVIESATKFLREGSVSCGNDSTIFEELQSGVEFENHNNELAKQSFIKLTQDLLELIKEGKLAWKFREMSFEFLHMLLHQDILPSPKLVSLITDNCINNHPNIRKLSCSALNTVMELHKKKAKKILVNIEHTAGVGPINYSKLLPGDRPDNAWLQFDPKKFLSNEEDWNRTVFIEKAHWGYYTWPKELWTFAPYHEQPKYCRERHEIPAAEQPIYDCFMNEEYVEKLFNFLALEEEKSFLASVMYFSKRLFHNFEDSFLPQFQVHIEKLMKDTSHDRQVWSHRRVTEVLSGIILGSKLWPYSKVENLWLWITPLLEHALNNITVETDSSWTYFFFYICNNRAPQRLQWLYRLLLKNPVNGDGGAFGDSSRVDMLHESISPQHWKIPAYLHEIVNCLHPYLSHTSVIVRNSIASLLRSCQRYDYKVHMDSQTLSPKRTDFILSVLPELEKLRDYVASHSGDCSESSIEPDEKNEKDSAVRFCKTVIEWVREILTESFSPCLKEIFQLLLVIQKIQIEVNDEDLKHDFELGIKDLSKILLPKEYFNVALAAIKEVAGLKSWHARANILNYMQPMVFGNFFLLQGDHYKKTIQAMLLQLLSDEQLEVREKAAVTLSGFIHCNYLELNKDMLEYFEKLRILKVTMTNGSSIKPVPLQGLVKKHAGILGLSACVQAYPYDVPDFIPQVLANLSVHVNDPQPIGMTVTKTLSNFRRTHHDNWHQHKMMFTNDQLEMITDILISHNNYA